MFYLFYLKRKKLKNPVPRWISPWISLGSVTPKIQWKNYQIKFVILQIKSVTFHDTEIYDDPFFRDDIFGKYVLLVLQSSIL